MNNSNANGGSRIFPNHHPTAATKTAAATEKSLSAPQDKYDRFEDWLRENGAHFERVSTAACCIDV